MLGITVLPSSQVLYMKLYQHFALLLAVGKSGVVYIPLPFPWKLTALLLKSQISASQQDAH